MKIQIIILLVTISSLAAQDNAQVYCGRRLARTLAVLCSDDYVKRSGEQYDEYEPLHYETDQFIFPWLLEKAHALTGSRGKRQIVSECCEKACTIEEMMTYCGN